MTQTVSVTGDRQVIRGLLAQGRTASDLGDVMRGSASFAERQITGVPEDTGRLARSVAGGGEQLLKLHHDGYDLGSEVRYARFVFGGTRHMRARPPRINTSAIARDAADRINRRVEQA